MKYLLILDFDGTLTSIAGSPQEVVFEERTRRVLERLDRSRSCKIAIVSGRSLKDLLTYFDFGNFLYAGNHGLELKGHGLSLPQKAKKARKLEALVWLLAGKLKESFSKIPGVLIEDKNYTLSVHYRKVSPSNLPLFRQKMRFFMTHYKHWPLLWKNGKKVWEARPHTRWGKGEAALYLAKKFPRALPIVIGDDVTDEDMFRALKHRGITVRVGRSLRSQAEYYLKSPSDVRKFLQELADHES